MIKVIGLTVSDNLIKISSLTCFPYRYVSACEICRNPITGHVLVGQKCWIVDDLVNIHTRRTANVG